MPATPPSKSDRIDVPSPSRRSDWDAWGTERAKLPPGAKTILATLLSGKPRPVSRRGAPTLTPSRLGEQTRRALGAVVGEEHVAVDDGIRMLHLGG